MAIRGGSWGIGGWKLPELGLTERLAGAVSRGRTTDLSQAISRPQANNPPPPRQFPPESIVGGPVYTTNNQGQVVARTSTSSNPNTGGMPSSPVPQAQQQQQQQVQSYFDQAQQNIRSQEDIFNEQLENDYNSSLSMLSGQEESLKSQAGAAEGQIETGRQSGVNEITNSLAVAQEGPTSTLQTAETQGRNAMQQARDLFRQTQQQNIAQLSALGISSSSVSEALAERLGVETARRIAGVTGSLDEIRVNTQKELGRVKSYYEGKKTDLENWARDQKANIQNSLMQGINQINSARQQAASDKAARRGDLISKVQSAYTELEGKKLQYQQSLDNFANKKTQALKQTISDPKYLQSVQSTRDTLNESFTTSGFTWEPSGFDTYGEVKGWIKVPTGPQNDPTKPKKNWWD